MLRAKISGTGMYLPERRVTNKDLETLMDTTDEWIRQRSGIVERRWIREGELPADLAEKASRQALERAGTRPDADFWPAIIPAVRARHPGFTFIAEAYWDLEWELQRQGFDFCYDKRLYDRLEKEGAESVRLHLLADMAYQEKLVRFIENHDEPRAAAAFPGDRLRASAVTALTLPGAKLLHEGQLEGRRVRLPVFLGRRPIEAPEESLRKFYLRLLSAISDEVFEIGEWRLCECRGWPDNPSWRNLAAWCWRSGEGCRLVVVNLSGSPAQGLVRLPWGDVHDKSISLDDLFSGEHYRRQGNEMAEPGLYVDLPAWGYHVFKFRI